MEYSVRPDIPAGELLEGFRLDGQVALVTGAGRGIGRAIALALADAGANVVLAARTMAQLKDVAAEARLRDVRAFPVAMDVADHRSVDQAVSRAANELGPAQIVVNNAGNALYKPFIPLPDVETKHIPGFETVTTKEEWSTIIGTHLYGAFHVLQATVPAMLVARVGRVINIASISVIRKSPYVSSYDAAKGGLVALTRSLAGEWAPYGVTVNAIAPGRFHTDMSAPMHEDDRLLSWMMRRVPMRREGDVRDVGALAVFLASRWAGYLTGQLISIDGGETI